MKTGPQLIAAQWQVELRNTVRNGEQLLLLVAIPLAVFVVSRRFDQALITGLLAANFTSVAISTAFERRWGVLKSYATSPLALSHVVTAKALSALTVSLAQVLVLSAMSGSLSLRSLLAALAAAICLAPWALLLGTTIRAERVLAIANLTFMVLVGLLWVDSPLVVLTPTGSLMSVLSGNAVLGVIVATITGACGAVLTIRRGRWTE